MDTPHQQFRIAEIEVSRSPLNEKILGFFRYDNPGRKKNGPVLLIFAEIQSTLYVYERMLDSLNQAAEQMRYLTSGVELDPLSRFEKLIQRLNEVMAQFATAEEPISWKRVNIFIMELSEGHICLAGTGHLANMFLQKQADEQYKAFDLLGSLEQPIDVDPEKPFAALICGDIKPGDLFFVGSTNFDRLRGELHIKERLTSLPPVTAALEIKQDLERRNIPDDFMGAVLANIEQHAPTPAPIEETPRETSTTSIEKLRDTEKATDTHLAPIVTPMQEIKKTTRFAEQALAFAKEKATLLLKKRSTPSLSPASQAKPIKDPVALAGLRGANAGYGSLFKPKHKRMAIGIVGALIILGIGYGFWSNARKKAAEIAAWNSTYETAVDNRTRAESDLIYGNETKAKSELATAEQLLKSLPTDTTERQEKIAKTTQEISEIKERLKRVVKLDTVNELTSLPATVAESSLTAPVLTKDNAYAVDNDSHAILKVTLTNKETKRIQLPENAGRIVAGSEGKDSILFATSEGKLFTLNKTTDLVKPMTWDSRASSTADFVVYNSRIYSLDPQNNQIWRSSNSGGSFGSTIPYIKATSASLADGVGIAVDSNVFILKNNGTVVQYLSGAQEGFSLARIDPPARSASGIWTDLDVPILAITDAADKRVLIYDKSGQLQAQLTSSQFVAPRDVSGNYTSKQLIVVDGNRLLLVPIP
jgi:hypothetical protein